jgi:hypothetical protein
LELSFSTIELREIFEKRATAVEAIGIEAALELEQRLADIEALENVSDFTALFSDNTISRSPHEQSFQLKTGHEVIFRSGHVNTPATTSGAIDWTKVTRMRIVSLEVSDG